MTIAISLVISVHQGQSALHSEPIRANQKHSEPMRANQKHSEMHSEMKSEALRRTQKQSHVLSLACERRSLR